MDSGTTPSDFPHLSRESGSVDVIVIGAGHNGLACACYLARSGLKVLVLEAAEAVGGMTRTEALIPEAPLHRINSCAIDVLCMRASTVVADLELHRFGYQEVDVDPAAVALHPDGTSLGIWKDPVRTADEIRRFSPDDARAWLKFARTMDAVLDIGLPMMRTNPTRPAPRSLAATAASALRHLRQTPELGRLFTATTAEYIAEHFRHPIVRGPLAVYTSALPSNVDGSAGALLAFGLIHRFGLGRVVGGTQGLPDALVRCLRAAGGQVRTSAGVEQLVVSEGNVTGVRLQTGEELKARAVVASCNPFVTLTELLPSGTLPEKLELRAASIPTTNMGVASMKVDVALSGRLELSRHERQRSDGLDLRKPVALVGTFDQVRSANALSQESRIPDYFPSCAAIPTAADPSQAPAGQDTLYFYLTQVPLRPASSWSSLAEQVGKAVLSDASNYYDGIEELEIGRRVETPEELARRAHAPNGNVFHVDVSPFHLGPLRPIAGFGGYRTPVPGLFLTGAGTHPIPGVSGISGQLAAAEVRRFLR